MTELIKTWITNRIGIIMNMKPDIFAANVMDGTIITKILYSYNIISQNQSIKVLPTDNPAVAFKNLELISCWLKAVGIFCNEDDLKNIANENSLSAIKLFYELYLNLHDKDKLYFTAKTRANQKLHRNDLRFEVSNVGDRNSDLLDFTTHPLSEPLMVRRDVIDWNENHYRKLLKSYDDMRRLYAKYIEKKFHASIICESNSPVVEIKEITDSQNLKYTKFKEFTYEELVDQQSAALKLAKFKEDPKVTQKIVKKLKQKRRQEIHEHEIKAHQQKMLLLELWNNLLTKQENEFDNAISNKLLKQSMFEKQMVTKMFEIRQQKHNMLYNRRFIDEQTMEKKEKEFLEQVFLREKGAGDQKFNYYLERERALELHQRLYAERLRLDRERNSNTCTDVIKDIVDISIRHSEYMEKYDVNEVPKLVQCQWANLFTKQQPIFDILEDPAEIVQDNENLPKDIEEIYCIELHRQDALNQREFEKYVNCEWPWELEDLLTNYEDNLVPLQLGRNVLGHNIHRVLLTKYPKTKPPQKPKLPKFRVAACVNGLTELTILPVLQKLLDFKGIKVVEMQQAINYCLNIFKEEIKTEYIDDTLIKETQVALKEVKSKGKVKAAKATDKDKGKGKGKGKGKKPVEIDEDTFPKRATVECQTPRIYPCEEIVLSYVGELGKTADDLLNIGEELRDNLIVAMFIEYIKTLGDFEGWVLINYPTSFKQAVILEEALTGVEMPHEYTNMKVESTSSIGDISDLVYRESQWERDEGLWQSQLLPNPEPLTEPSHYNTFLTAFISLRLRENDSSEIPDNVPGALEEFYTGQGCNYELFYQTYELATIKHLAKLIIGEYTIPPKASVELFGETVNYLQVNLNQFEATPGKVSKVLKKDQKPVVVTSKVEESAPVIVEIPAPPLPPKTPPPEPIAGEVLWRYVDLPFPDFFQLSLAALWENTENVYIGDLKELFFIRRLVMNAVVPYLTHFKKHMTLFIARPDDKQNHLFQFQTMYNNFDDDMRDDNEVKAEIHCRINEFRDEMWEISDNRMRESEYERQRVIQESWLPYQACELANNYTNTMQLEIDRCCDSFQFITDYYHGVITKMPCREAPLQKTILRKIIMNTSSISVTSTANRLIEAMIDILIQPEQSSGNTYFHETIKMSLSTAQGIVDKWNSTTSTFASKMETLTKPKKPGKPGKDGKSGKAAKPPKAAKGGKSPKGGEAQLPPFLEPDPDVQAIVGRLIQEWRCAIQGELLRVKLRLNMVAEKGVRDLNDMLNCCQKAFYTIYDDIKDRYMREMNSINSACEVFAQATEAEVKLQEALIFDGDKFYIDPETILFHEPLPEPEPPLREREVEGVFTVEQLEALVNILLKISPYGSIPERAFVFLLQDMIVQNAEDGKEPMVPLLWQKLLPKQVSQLSKELFGNVELIDWKDFIIYNLCVRFPTQEDLISVRNQFIESDPDLTEIVLSYQFYSTVLWFDSDFDDADLQAQFRFQMIKKVLFNMFKVKEDGFNYTAFLLGFCKDQSPMEGFAKGLSLILGKYVCWNPATGEAYMKSVLEQRFLDEQAELELQRLHEEAVKCAESVVDTLIDTTVHVCDSVVIESYNSEETPNNTALEFDNITTDNEDKQVVQIFSRNFSSIEYEMSEFSNVEIGYQPYYDENHVYLLSFDLILTLLTTALPWHAKAQTINDESIRQRLEIIFDKLKRKDFNNNVFAFELLNDKEFETLLMNNFKFVEKFPPQIVTRIINDKCV